MSTDPFKKHIELISTEDIFPIGSYEALPVHIVNKSYASYPNVVRLTDQKFDISELLQEYHFALPKMNKFLYGSERKNKLIGMTVDQVSELHQGLGFTDNTYSVYSLRKLGTTEFNEFAGEKTRSVISQFGAIFRQQYMVALPDLLIQPHFDNQNSETHGFRVHIPLEWYYIGFQGSGDTFELYVLPPGFAYYINSSKMHFVCNPLSGIRVSIAFQLNSDQLITNRLTHFCEPHVSDTFLNLTKSEYLEKLANIHKMTSKEIQRD